MRVTPPLAKSQLRLLNLVAGGLRYKEIAAAIGSKPNLVEQSMVLLRRRMGVRTNAQAVAVAYVRGLVAVEPDGEARDAQG